MMMRLEDNRLETTNSAVQFSLMITIKEGDLTLGLRILRNSISNPDTETRTIRHPIDKLASTQMGTELQTQIDSIIKTDQATPGRTDPTTDSRLSITSMLDQRAQILNTMKIFQRAKIYLHATQSNLSTFKDKM